MRIRPLTQEQFRDALGKGLGRAFLHVRHFGAAGLHEELLRACLQSFAVDPQWEGTRADWIFAILKHSGELDSFRQPVLAALQGAVPGVTLYWDYVLWIKLATKFALRGDQLARQIIYRKFDEGAYDFSDAGRAVIQLDGMAGVLRVAEVVGARLREDVEFRDDNSFVSYAQKRFGEPSPFDNLLEEAFGSEMFTAPSIGDKPTVLEVLEAKSLESENVAAFLLSEKERRDRRSPAWGGTERKLSLTDVMTGVENDQELDYMGFGRDTTESNALELFAWLLEERDPKRLFRLLEVFQLRRIPYLDSRLFELIESEDRYVRRAAARMLSNNRHEEIRRFALRMLREEDLNRRAVGCDLLALNARGKDLRTITDSLPTAGDPDELHAIAEALLNIVGWRKHAEDANLLRWVYDYNACSHCRNGAVEYLLTRFGLPPEQAHECCWDCLDLTRRLVRKAERRRRRRDT